MSKRAWSFYHMRGFIFIAFPCHRINALRMIILCLKGHNSRKFMRSWSLVLSHSSISMKLWEEVFWPKWVLCHCLILLHVLTGIKSLNISRTSGPSCMVPLELDVSVSIAGINSSKATWEGTVFNKQKLFPWRQEETGSLSANTYTSKNKNP